MKIAIDNTGLEVEVSDDTAVKTVNGVHYLLTPEDEAEIAARESAWAGGANARQNEEATRSRKAAYTDESDPIFFKYQRGEATEQEWLDKITEIRARFPKSE